MNEPAFVSIILPTFNGEKYIAKAIESCLQQSYVNLELIIVNDCSTDNTASIIKAYQSKDSRIKIVNNGHNKKLPASLNIGFDIAAGSYFTWISDDNLFGEKAIEVMVAAIEHSHAHIVYSSYHYINEAGNKLDHFNALPEELIFKCAPGACFLYKKEVHQALKGFDESKFRMEDMDFWLRAATKFRYHHIDQKTLYYYRKHNDNLTTAIFSNPELYKKYRENHLLSFRYFFNSGLNFDITPAELECHLELYFEDIVIHKNWNGNISDKILAYMDYLQKLKELPWHHVGFDNARIQNVINAKMKKMVALVINDLVFENKKLQKKNPQLAAQLNKPISWYYKEYEVLPAWYKKVGHIIKAVQGNKSWRSLLNNETKR